MLKFRTQHDTVAGFVTKITVFILFVCVYGTALEYPQYKTPTFRFEYEFN